MTGQRRCGDKRQIDDSDSEWWIEREGNGGLFFVFLNTNQRVVIKRQPAEIKWGAIYVYDGMATGIPLVVARMATMDFG